MRGEPGIPDAVYIVGKSNSGKTTIATKLISDLNQRGFKVAAVKHGHHAGEFDQPGKDSWQMAKAGAEAVGFLSSEKTFMLIKTQKETALRDLVRNFVGFDVVIVEGYKAAAVPKIEVVRRANGNGLVCSPDELLAIVTDIHFNEAVPQFSFEEIRELSSFVIKTLHLCATAE